jgi:thiamine biosynthesis lipoprotein
MLSLRSEKFVLSVCLLVGLTAHAQTGKRLISAEAEAMGTSVKFVAFTDDEPGVRKAFDDALAEIKRLENLMTTWRADSDVSKVNAAAGVAPVVVSPETLEVVEMSQRASQMSDGAFDISFYAMHGLWKFDEDMVKKIPDTAEIAKKKALINYRNIVVDHSKRTVFLKHKGMAINLGGIAKGYAVDRAVAVMKKAGFADVIVQAGGDLMCSGQKGAAPWTTGIRDPRGPREDVFAVMKLADHAFSTAGDYERFFILDGKRYHHIIDPKTGWPATGTRSVTIYAPNAFLADAVDDAVFILGWKKGLDLVAGLPGVGAVVVDDNGQVHMSKGMDKYVTVLHPPRP